MAEEEGAKKPRKGVKLKQPKEEKLGIDQGLAFLEQTIQKLSDSDLSLEESFALFERGMKVLRDTESQVEEVEKKVKVISADGRAEELS